MSTHTAKEILWTRAFLTELTQPLIQLTTLFGENQSAIALANYNQFHAHTKHIDVHYHFICETIKNGAIKLIYCPTNDMVADMFTKPLPHEKLQTLHLILGLHTD